MTLLSLAPDHVRATVSLVVDQPRGNCDYRNLEQTTQVIIIIKLPGKIDQPRGNCDYWNLKESNQVLFIKLSGIADQPRGN